MTAYQMLYMFVAESIAVQFSLCVIGGGIIGLVLTHYGEAHARHTNH